MQKFSELPDLKIFVKLVARVKSYYSSSETGV